MPPPPPVYLPGGVPDAILDAELNLASVAPGTPPRVDEDPHAFPPVAYECYGTATTRWWTRSIGAEAMKFAEYERRLRDWEESEKRRQRAVVDAARFSAEAEEYRRAHERRVSPVASRASAAARGDAAAAGEFDEYDAKGKRKMHPGAGGAKRARTGAAPTAEDSSDDEDDGVTLATLQKKGKARDKKKSHKAKKRAAGTARPWTPVEDQLLCAIVHEFGSNWGLITDVFAASAPFKGVYRRAEQCRWRFQALTQSAEGEGDPNAMAALNLNKGSARQTMSRALPVEDNTARLHFDRAAQAQARHVKLRRQHAAERAGDDLSRRAPAHQSWNAHRALQAADPLELADQALMEAARAQQAQQQQRRHQMGGGAPGWCRPGAGMPGGGGVVGGGMGPGPGRPQGPGRAPGQHPQHAAQHAAQRQQQQQQYQMQQQQMQMQQQAQLAAAAAGKAGAGKGGKGAKGTAGTGGKPRPAPAPSRRAGWGRRTRPRRAPPQRWRCPRCPWRGARARGRNRARRRVWRRGCTISAEGEAREGSRPGAPGGPPRSERPRRKTPPMVPHGPTPSGTPTRARAARLCIARETRRNRHRSHRSRKKGRRVAGARESDRESDPRRSHLHPPPSPSPSPQTVRADGANAVSSRLPRVLAMVVDRPPPLSRPRRRPRLRRPGPGRLCARARCVVVPSGIVFASASRRMQSIPAARKRRANHASMSNLRRSIGRTSPPRATSAARFRNSGRMVLSRCRSSGSPTNDAHGAPFSGCRRNENGLLSTNTVRRGSRPSAARSFT